MKIAVAYKWTSNPQDASVFGDGKIDWSSAKPGISEYDPVAIELGRRLADTCAAELIGLTRDHPCGQARHHLRQRDPLSSNTGRARMRL